MYGAESLLDALVQSGVEVCFANPGTSEMQLVAAIGNTEGMRAVLCLFEGVATAAADGYGRMLDKPAATLLHLGPGFANGMANLHNARRAGVPLLNIVGDHATYHLQYDAPLTTDLDAYAALGSHEVIRTSSAEDIAASGVEAVAAALAGNGRLSTLLVPADHAWSAVGEEGGVVPALPVVRAAEVPGSRLEQCVQYLGNGKRTGIILGGRALREDALHVAGQLASHTGVELLFNTSPARMARGAGRVLPTRIAYLVEQAREQLQDFEQLIVLGGEVPVSFFAYPGLPSSPVPDGCEILQLADREQDVRAALDCLVAITGAEKVRPQVQSRQLPDCASGPLTLEAIGATLCRLMPAQAIVSDEAITSGRAIYPQLSSAEPHDWMTLTGGAIGQGLPLALGAAVACPQRKVIALQADGSGMYTVQALWSMAREQADVTVIIFNNGAYAILRNELARVGADAVTDKALDMLDLEGPPIQWRELATSLGVSAFRAETAEAFEQAFAQCMQQGGPKLIEAVIP